MFLVCFSVCTFTIVLLLFVPSRAPRLYSHPMSVLVISMFFLFRRTVVWALMLFWQPVEWLYSVTIIVWCVISINWLIDLLIVWRYMCRYSAWSVTYIDSGLWGRRRWDGGIVKRVFHSVCSILLTIHFETILRKWYFPEILFTWII